MQEDERAKKKGFNRAACKKQKCLILMGYTKHQMRSIHPSHENHSGNFWGGRCLLLPQQQGIYTHSVQIITYAVLEF